MTDEYPLDASLVIESQMTNPPRPIGFGVLNGGKIVAVLTYEQMKEAMEKWAAMQRTKGDS